MLFRSKTPKAKKAEFYKMERQIIEFVVQELNEIEAWKLNKQLCFLTYKKRIVYPKSLVSEFYPENFGDIKEEDLFHRTEEFRLAKLKVISNLSSIIKISKFV